MARAIKQGGPLLKPKKFPPSPVLRGDAASVYKRSYPDRFKLFGNKMRKPTRVASQEPLPVFRHELRHDAESSVWVFFRWVVFAAPQGKESVCISHTIWSLISSDGPAGNYRDRLLHTLKYRSSRKEFVHPEYCQLMPLVRSMATLIKKDYHWVKEEKYKHPEYLLDALQRVILNFVLENKEASFMDLQKNIEYRQVEPLILELPECVRRRERLLYPPASTPGRKRKATGSSVHETQLLSTVSCSGESSHDKFMVCLIA